MNKKRESKAFQVAKQPSPAELTDFSPFCLREETEYTLKPFLHPLTFAAVSFSEIHDYHNKKKNSNQNFGDNSNKTYKCEI